MAYNSNSRIGSDSATQDQQKDIRTVQRAFYQVTIVKPAFVAAEDVTVQNLPVTFPVKEVIFKLSYNLISTAVDEFYMITTMNLPDSSNLVGTMGRLSIKDGLDFIYTNDFCNETRYLFREPTKIFGNHSFIVKQGSGLVNTITAGGYVLSITFLG